MPGNQEQQYRDLFHEYERLLDALRDAIQRKQEQEREHKQSLKRFERKP